MNAVVKFKSSFETPVRLKLSAYRSKMQQGSLHTCCKEKIKHALSGITSRSVVFLHEGVFGQWRGVDGFLNRC